jgi:hypothetical protein
VQHEEGSWQQWRLQDAVLEKAGCLFSLLDGLLEANPRHQRHLRCAARILHCYQNHRELCGI